MKTINVADNMYKYAAELLQKNKLEGHVIEEIQEGDYVYKASLTFNPISITANKEKKYQVTAIERNKGEYGQDIYHIGKTQRLDRLTALKAD
ncbi:hypothetical protein [Thalassomonas sp. RHCl1]|uniref:hypothetical protein n=1 Tax=Thalassomonas sp. RHCl1 TaxID=2995320 RepID=UPI00248C4996|nr:hypothetical protein [Thalassomonas sp. RHCl1]